MAKKFNLSNKSSSKTLGEKAKILENGLMHNIEVLDISDNDKKEFRILSGERRYQAIKYLRQSGVKFDTIPCKVIKGLNQIDEEIHLIKGNSDTRVISEEEKRKQIERLTELYNIKNKHQGTKINAKKEIAKELQVSERTIERYNNINNKLILELQEFFDNKVITLTEGDKFAKLDEQVQLAILEVLKQQNKISKEEIEIIKSENNKLLEEKALNERQIKEKEELINNYQKINNELEEKEKYIKEKLEEKEKENAEKLKNNNIQLESKIKELENKLRVETSQQRDFIKKEVLNEKAKNLRKTVIKDIIELADLIKNNNLDIADETIIELERTINVFKYKNNKK